MSTAPQLKPVQREQNRPLTSPSYWDTFARTYHALRPPLVPAREDLCVMERAMAECADRLGGGAMHALMLGVTPNIARMRWPERSFLLAVDRCEPMVQRVWPGDVPGVRQAICGNWLSLPADDGSQDAVISDCAVNCVRYPDDLRQLVASVRRVLRDDGVLVMRCFVQPPEQEDPVLVMEELTAYASFHHFKLRLLMALQQSSAAGIAVNDVYRFWTSYRIDVADLALRTGWDRRDIDTIEMHSATNTIHTFPHLDEVRDALSPHFRETTVCTPNYSLGVCCPLLVLKP